MAELVFVVLCIAGVFVLAMRRAPLWGWALALAAAQPSSGRSGMLHGELRRARARPARHCWPGCRWSFWPALSIPALRRAGADRSRVFRKIKGILPKVSDTEQQALEAGTVGFDAELFSGQPDWDKLRAVPADHADRRRRRPSSTGRPKSCAA